MIQINAVTTTKGGLSLPSGVLLNVTPHFRDNVVDMSGVPTTKYTVSFDVKIYKDMNAYENGEILTRDEIVEFNIGYIISDIDIQSLSVNVLLGFLATHIENGDSVFPGIGVGNTSIVFPTV